MTTMQMFTLIAGLCLFLYGINQVTKNLQKLAGASLRHLVAKLTRTRLRGFVMGIFTAFGLQSSGAAILMLIAFANAGLISLERSIPIILGAGIGSTLTVQLLAFKIYKISSIIIVVGYVMMFLLKNSLDSQPPPACPAIMNFLVRAGVFRDGCPAGWHCAHPEQSGDFVYGGLF